MERAPKQAGTTRTWAYIALVAMSLAGCAARDEPAPEAKSPSPLPDRSAALAEAAKPAKSATAKTLSESEILLGMPTVLSGRSAEMGMGARDGAMAAVERFNREGGIHGRPLRLLAIDDSYEPRNTPEIVEQLIDSDGALLLLGTVGAPNALAALPVAEDSKTLLYAPLTGAAALRRDPPNRYVINFRASHHQETDAVIGALMDIAGLKADEIGFFTKRDAEGEACFIGGVVELRKRGLGNRQVFHCRYERNTLAVENAVADVISADPPPRAIILAGEYAACAKFIRLARQNGHQSLYVNLSTSAGQSFHHRLLTDGNGVILTQVVPDLEADLPIVREYRADQEAVDADADLSFSGLEAYISVRVLGKALKSLSALPTRESVIDALEGLGEFDIGLGTPLRLSPQRHQACDKVWTMIIRDGKIVPYSWEELKSHPALESKEW